MFVYVFIALYTFIVFLSFVTNPRQVSNPGKVIDEWKSVFGIMWNSIPPDSSMTHLKRAGDNLPTFPAQDVLGVEAYERHKNAYAQVLQNLQALGIETSPSTKVGETEKSPKRRIQRRPKAERKLRERRGMEATQRVEETTEKTKTLDDYDGNFFPSSLRD